MHRRHVHSTHQADALPARRQQRLLLNHKTRYESQARAFHQELHNVAGTVSLGLKKYGDKRTVPNTSQWDFCSASRPPYNYAAIEEYL